MPQSNFEQRTGLLRQALTKSGFKAAIIESGAAMRYFTGVRWGRSERTFAVVIPASGPLAFVCPGFEEMRARELIQAGSDVRVWQEDESPFQRIVEILHDRGVDAGRVAFDPAMRFFVFDGIRSLNPKLELVSAGAALSVAGLP